MARPEERKSLNDFFVEAGDFVRSDGGDNGPPRWFSPLECGARAPESPLLLYLPGLFLFNLGLSSIVRLIDFVILIGLKSNCEN